MFKQGASSTIRFSLTFEIFATYFSLLRMLRSATMTLFGAVFIFCNGPPDPPHIS